MAVLDCNFCMGSSKLSLYGCDIALLVNLPHNHSSSFPLSIEQELVDHLSVILTPYPVEVIRGGGVSDGYIEVRPAGASKGNCISSVYMYVCVGAC